MSADDAYSYDVFVSWRREAPVLPWFQRYFRPEFEARLRSTLGHDPRIFVDEGGVQTGDAWPQRLQQAHQRSKLLLAIWEPQYFRSRWCLSELESMHARERMLGFRTGENPRGLVLPVIMRDGQHFQEWLDRIQGRRLAGGLVGAPAFGHSLAYLDFVAAIDALCEDVERALGHVPSWSPEFPRMDVGIQAATPLALPRFP